MKFVRTKDFSGVSQKEKDLSDCAKCSQSIKRWPALKPKKKICFR